MILNYKIGQILLQNTTAIVLQIVINIYYKMSQVVYYKMRQFDYKLQQLLQIAMFVTKCVVTTSFLCFPSALQRNTICTMAIKNKLLKSAIPTVNELSQTLSLLLELLISLRNSCENIRTGFAGSGMQYLRIIWLLSKNRCSNKRQFRCVIKNNTTNNHCVGNHFPLT